MHVFNDEGEHWCKQNITQDQNPNFMSIEYWYGYDEKEYREKLILKQEMKKLFESQNIKSVHPESVKEFLEKMEKTDNILITCSRRGKSI